MNKQNPISKYRGYYALVIFIWLIQLYSIIIFIKPIIGTVDRTGWGVLGIMFGAVIGLPILFVICTLSIVTGIVLIKQLEISQRPNHALLIKIISILINLSCLVIILIYVAIGMLWVKNNPDKIDIRIGSKKIHSSTNSLKSDPESQLVGSVIEVTNALANRSNPLPSSLELLKLSDTSKNYIKSKTITYTPNTKKSEVTNTHSTQTWSAQPKVTKYGNSYYTLCVVYTHAYTSDIIPNPPETDADGYTAFPYFFNHTAGSTCYKILRSGAVE